MVLFLLFHRPSSCFLPSWYPCPYSEEGKTPHGNFVSLVKNFNTDDQSNQSHSFNHEAVANPPETTDPDVRIDLDTLICPVQSWVIKNQDYQYVLMSNDGANRFVTKHYFDRTFIRQTFLGLGYPIFRADLLRYMLLEMEGGVYTDIDTTALKPIQQWIPEPLRPYTRVVVGIEYDNLGRDEYSHGFGEPISFCQWTLAASPGHPMLRKAVEQVVQALNQQVKEDHTTLASLKVQDNQVGSITGPGIWTRVVFESLSAAVGSHAS